MANVKISGIGTTTAALSSSYLFESETPVGNSEKTPFSVLTASTQLALRDTDVTLAANSDLLFATQKAVKAYVDNNAGVPFAVLQDYGTLANDGTTDDAAVWQAAAASGARVIFACGLNCRIGSTINIAAGQTWVLSGTSLNFTGSTLTTFAATTVDDWALVGPFTITGAGSSVGTAKGISISGSNRWRVENYSAKSIQGHGLYLVPGSPSGTLRADQGQVSNMLALSCYIGWEDTPGAGSEYCLVSNFTATGCGIGVKTTAGNIVWSNINCVDNTSKGFTMAGGANHAHGIVSGLNANHNPSGNLELVAVINGQTFNGPHIYEGSILLDGCKGVTLNGGAIDANIINNSGTGSGDCLLTGVFFPGDYGVATITGTDPDSLVTKGTFGAGCPGNTDVRCKSKSAAYTFVMDDEAVHHPSADTTARIFTIPANSSVPYRIGKCLTITNENGAGVITIAITTDTMRLAGAGTTGSRTLAANGIATAIKVDATSWLISGTGLT